MDNMDIISVLVSNQRCMCVLKVMLSYIWSTVILFIKLSNCALVYDQNYSHQQMVRRYKSKCIVRQYDADNLTRAVADVKTGTLSVRKAANMYSIPRSTIGNYVNGRSVPGTALGRKPALPQGIERELVNTAQDAAAAGFSVS